VIEDDTQDGVDHVDGARGPVQIISPWAQHGTVDSHYYTQITMIRTIEQMLGIQPMNQKDSAATPMSRAFTNKPDYTPFKAVRNQVPLTDGLATPPACGNNTRAGASAARTQTAASTVPADKQHIANVWAAWQKDQHLSGPNAVPDYAPPALMDHFTWYQAHNWTTPYPGEQKILTPAEVPGRYLPSPESDG
jgi:hypothetical protein